MLSYRNRAGEVAHPISFLFLRVRLGLRGRRRHRARLRHHVGRDRVPGEGLAVYSHAGSMAARWYCL